MCSTPSTRVPFTGNSESVPLGFNPNTRVPLSGTRAGGQILQRVLAGGFRPGFGSGFFGTDEPTENSQSVPLGFNPNTQAPLSGTRAGEQIRQRTPSGLKDGGLSRAVSGGNGSSATVYGDAPAAQKPRTIY